MVTDRRFLKGKGMVKGKLFDQVVRYDVVFYDSLWNEMPELHKSMLTAHELIICVDAFNSAQQRFLRSGDILTVGLCQAAFMSIGVVYVEV